MNIAILVEREGFLDMGSRTKAAYNMAHSGLKGLATEILLVVSVHQWLGIGLFFRNLFS
jgi:hypothetical protein